VQWRQGWANLSGKTRWLVACGATLYQFKDTRDAEHTAQLGLGGARLAAVPDDHGRRLLRITPAPGSADDAVWTLEALLEEGRAVIPPHCRCFYTGISYG
jgi:hypothetical protein